MRGISREVLARDAAWTLGDGDCKDLTVQWSTWEHTYATAVTTAARAEALAAPAAICTGCPITTKCADLARLSEYTGIAGGVALRNGAIDRLRLSRRAGRKVA